MEFRVQAGSGATLIAIVGSVDEGSDFTAVLKQLNAGGRFVIDLAGVPRINSSGVREWIHFVSAIKPSASVELINCPPPFIDQINMLRNFLGPIEVKTVMVPFFCPDCGETETATGDLAALRDRDPEPPPCRACGTAMEIDAVPETYFAFLRNDRGS